MHPGIVLLLSVLMISSLCGWLMAGCKAQEKPVKIMLFVGYFWLSTFIQLLLVAGAYYVWHKF
ncbi:MAG: hypothetical protein PHH11_14745 [Methylomonas sp.]|nr:hypothetical protein [Methylomonas sp.]